MQRCAWVSCSYSAEVNSSQMLAVVASLLTANLSPYWLMMFIAGMVMTVTPPPVGVCLPVLLISFLCFSPSLKVTSQYGKGAPRFFPSDPSCPTCLVKIVHAYILEADLSSGQHLFAGPKFVVTVDILSATLKATATFIGLPADRVSIHSIRVGGLVSLFAADVPDSLKQLAGRWASQRSFVAYARATMQQFTTIASALNDANLVFLGRSQYIFQYTMSLCFPSSLWLVSLHPSSILFTAGRSPSLCFWRAVCAGYPRESSVLRRIRIESD